MTPARKRLWKAICGGVIALSSAVLLLYRPSAWIRYAAWSIERIGPPLFLVCASVLGVGFVLMALSRYRHKPELLAAALALSAALHLLLAATFSLLEVGIERRPYTKPEIHHEVSLGLPSLAEEQISREMREALLKPLERDTPDLDADKQDTPEMAETPIATPSAPVLEAASDPDPSVLEPLQSATVENRLPSVADPLTAAARAEAEFQNDRVVTIPQLETAADIKEERQPARTFNADRAAIEPVTIRELETAVPQPELPAPDRAVKAETPPIRIDHATPQALDAASRQAEIENTPVRLDVPVTVDAMLAAPETRARTPDGRTALVVPAPARSTVDLTLETVKTPEAQTQTGSAVPQPMTQELPADWRRETPDDPRSATVPARRQQTDATPLPAVAALVETLSPPEAGQPPRSTGPVELASPGRTLTPLSAGETASTAARPEFTGKTIVHEGSLAAQQAVPVTRPDTPAPRIEAGMPGAVPSRQSVEDTAAIGRQVSLLLALADEPAGAVHTAAGTAQRELQAGRAASATTPDPALMARPSPPSATADPTRETSAPSPRMPTLAQTQVQMERQDAPHMPEVPATESPARSARGTETMSTLAALPARMSTVEVPQEHGTGTSARATMTVAPAARAASGAPMQAETAARMEAPLAPSRTAATGGSLATATVPATVPPRVTPSAPPSTPTGPATAIVLPQATLVAGQIRPAAVTDSSPSAPQAGMPGATPTGRVNVERAQQAATPSETSLDAQRRTAPILDIPTPEPTDGTLIADAPAGGMTAGRSRARELQEAPVSARRQPADEGGTAMPLPVTAWAIARAPQPGTTGTVTSAPRALTFQTIAKAPSVTYDESSASAAPIHGWSPPPLPPSRGSGVRLSLATDSMPTRRSDVRVETAATGKATTPRDASDMAAVTAISGMKAIYELRSPEKRRFIEELGGSPETEEAVEQALIWLAGAQSANGRWSVGEFEGVDTCGGAGDRIDGDVAVTGLSLLAYLGAGYTHMGRTHQATIQKGLEWLIEGQAADGDLRRGGTLYDQAMATAALCESLSLTGDRRLLAAAQLAAGFIMRAQTPEAAWRYEPRVDSDTSVLGWQILALKSAEIAGIEISPKHYAWSGLWLDQVRKGSGGLYAYKPGHGPTPVMTAEGWFCQLFMGEETRDQGRQESIAYLLEHPPEWNVGARGTVHLYYWYYATLALRLAEAPEFEIWNRALKKALLDGRRLDGPAAGSWDPVCQLGSRGGRVYMTAMAALCLEVYYRYLPFYRRTTTER